jgi:AraC-like DNA-binding protein/quercetin dioxygenase-like cupin family protein
MPETMNVTKETVAHHEHLNVRLYHNDTSVNFPMHWHTDYEIIMPLENIFTVEIAKKTYVLNPKDILIIPSGEIHELTAPPFGQRIIALFDHSLFRDLYGFDSINNYCYPCIVLRAEEENNYHLQLISLLEQIANEYDQCNPFYETYIHSLFINFFVILGRNFIKQENLAIPSKNQIQHKYIENVLNICKYINDHCTEELTLIELSTLAGFSKYHFSRIFHQYAGTSYYNYLMKRRILYAETLLCDPSLSITDIAMQCGFNCSSSFNRNFRKLKNCSPNEFRSMYHSKIYKALS